MPVTKTSRGWRYEVETPHGVVTRTSQRVYHHVVTAIMTLVDDREYRFENRFCGRLDLAEKAAADIRKNGTGLVEKVKANGKLVRVPAKKMDVHITPISWSA